MSTRLTIILALGDLCSCNIPFGRTHHTKFFLLCFSGKNVCGVRQAPKPSVPAREIETFPTDTHGVGVVGIVNQPTVYSNSVTPGFVAVSDPTTENLVEERRPGQGRAGVFPDLVFHWHLS